MPLPGGPADKIGNRYEALWTVLRMIDVMTESADSICLEPLGPEGEGIEFRLSRPGRHEYHQAKRQISGPGNWTVATLCSKGVLQVFRAKLAASPTSLCVFVSGHTAHPLDELAQRAEGATDFPDFQTALLSSEQCRIALQELSRKLGCPEPEVWALLRGIEVRTIDEASLREMIEARLGSLVESEPAAARDVLAQLALDSVNSELTAHDIWQHLEARGLKRRSWANDPHVLARVDDVTDRYLQRIEKLAIGGRTIARAETTNAVDLLRVPANSKRCVLLAGEAGVGKSGVAAQVVKLLRDAGWPVLAFRVDRLDSTDHPNIVGEQLRLPGSPAQVLAAIAHNRECLLVIDQLDAVSLASGREPQFFECINEIIQQALAHPNMRLLLGCREFDLKQDHRLRKLAGTPGIADKVTVGSLSAETVKEVVSDLGLEAGRLSDSQVRLLAIPLHLSLLTQVAEGSAASQFNFTSVQQLFDAYWEEKQRRVDKRLGRDSHWSEVVDRLCDRMSESQRLSAAWSCVDDFRQDVKAMASEHVVIIEDHQVSFFHQSFFDYAFARRFAARGGKVADLLGAGEQHLFRRAQVRQILAYERQDDRQRYLTDLTWLLTAPEVRFHIKQVVLAFLSELPDPEEDEWRIVLRIPTACDAAISDAVWAVVMGSAPWFRLVRRLGIVKDWLASSDGPLVDRTVSWLYRVTEEEADAVAELMEPYLGTTDEWRNRLAFLVPWRARTSRRLFDLFLRLIDDGTLDDTNAAFWAWVSRISEPEPGWACEAIGHYLSRRLALSEAKGQPNPFDRLDGSIPHGGRDFEGITECARAAPEGFIDEVLPFMLHVIESTVEPERHPQRDPVWGSRDLYHAYDADEQVLAAMEVAFRQLALDQLDAFARLSRRLRPSAFETVQFLLIRGYAASAAVFADEAADYLVERPEHLGIGYNGAGHARVWASRELLLGITPHCSPDRFAKLERAIMEYYPDWERAAEHRQHRGWSQLALVDALDPNRRSPAANRRWQELQRKFPGELIYAGSSIGGGPVSSPIPSSAAEKMSDEQWLSAMAHYPCDDRRLRSDATAGSLPVGGAHEMAPLLGGEAKRDPQRFSALLLRFPDDTDPSYFIAVLAGVAAASPDPETVLVCCRRAHSLPGRPLGRSIAEVIQAVAQCDLADELLDILGWYATEDRDPARDFWRPADHDATVYYGGDIIMAGINSVRGAAAETIGKLVLKKEEYVGRLRAILDALVADPVIAVRALAAYCLLGVLRHDRDYAVELFLRLCETEDILLGTRGAEQFLYSGLFTHLPQLCAIIDRMLNSSTPEAAEAGARLACLAGLDVEGAADLADRCLSGSEIHRKGAATIFAGRLTQVHMRVVCEDGLRRLFSDPAKDVRTQAAECFRNIESDQFGDYVELAQSFVTSPAYADAYGPLLSALEDSTAKLPEFACSACDKFLDLVGADAGRISAYASFEADRASKLIVRAYAQAEGNEPLQSKCLDVIDRMFQLGAHGIDEATDAFDR